ncbi:uncharacterized protein V2V93DRAFT_364715 [Kockiozyma suomiensis]|uniref:uncharacterized protein n=1 Tax=Kockiozyma suomiensis TaxID=1337062 RepID=UPI00334367E9
MADTIQSFEVVLLPPLASISTLCRSLPLAAMPSLLQPYLRRHIKKTDYLLEALPTEDLSQYIYNNFGISSYVFPGIKLSGAGCELTDIAFGSGAMLRPPKPCDFEFIKNNVLTNGRVYICPIGPREEKKWHGVSRSAAMDQILAVQKAQETPIRFFASMPCVTNNSSTADEPKRMSSGNCSDESSTPSKKSVTFAASASNSDPSNPCSSEQKAAPSLKTCSDIRQRRSPRFRQIKRETSQLASLARQLQFQTPESLSSAISEQTASAELPTLFSSTKVNDSLTLIDPETEFDSSSTSKTSETPSPTWRSHNPRLHANLKCRDIVPSPIKSNDSQADSCLVVDADYSEMSAFGSTPTSVRDRSYSEIVLDPLPVEKLNMQTLKTASNKSPVDGLRIEYFSNELDQNCDAKHRLSQSGHISGNTKRYKCIHSLYDTNSPMLLPEQHVDLRHHSSGCAEDTADSSDDKHQMSMSDFFSISKFAC